MYIKKLNIVQSKIQITIDALKYHFLTRVLHFLSLASFENTLF